MKQEGLFQVGLTNISARVILKEGDTNLKVTDKSGNNLFPTLYEPESREPYWSVLVNENHAPVSFSVKNSNGDNEMVVYTEEEIRAARKPPAFRDPRNE